MLTMSNELKDKICSANNFNRQDFDAFEQRCLLLKQCSPNSLNQTETEELNYYNYLINSNNINRRNIEFTSMMTAKPIQYRKLEHTTPISKPISISEPIDFYLPYHNMPQFLQDKIKKSFPTNIEIQNEIDSWNRHSFRLSSFNPLEV